MMDSLELDHVMLNAAIELSLRDDNMAGKAELVSALLSLLEPPRQAELYELNSRINQTELALKAGVEDTAKALLANPRCSSPRNFRRVLPHLMHP